MPRPTLDQFELRIVTDLAGNPLGAVNITWMSDGTYAARPLDCGPFDALDDVYLALKSRLDLQGTLW